MTNSTTCEGKTKDSTINDKIAPPMYVRKTKDSIINDKIGPSMKVRKTKDSIINDKGK
jgi:hypothetical protein